MAHLIIYPCVGRVHRLSWRRIQRQRYDGQWVNLESGQFHWKRIVYDKTTTNDDDGAYEKYQRYAGSSTIIVDDRYYYIIGVPAAAMHSCKRLDLFSGDMTILNDMPFRVRHAGIYYDQPNQLIYSFGSSLPVHYTLHML
jgi:hypothetical protein